MKKVTLICLLMNIVLGYDCTLSFASRELAVTVYNQDFAVVKDTREIEINPHTKEAVLDDISACIDPTSVQISAVNNTGFSVIEQNFEYDLPNINTLLKRVIDNPIRILLDDGRVFEGILLSVESNRICLKDNRGDIKIINRNSHFYQIAFARLPKGMRLKPALVWKISGITKSKEKIEVAYQTSDFSWRADYNVTLNPISRTLSMNGWVTITNKCGMSFPDAHLKLVAGEIHKVKKESEMMENRAIVFAAKAAEPPAGFKEREFSEYHLYDLGRKTTLANNETKQIELFDVSDVKYRIEYVFDVARSMISYRRGRYSDIDGNGQISPLDVSIVFENNKKNQLGIPLPAGRVKLYQKDSQGTEHLVGTDNIGHIPKDETVRLTIGKAFDVLGSRKVIARRRISNFESVADIVVTIKNHKKQNVPIIVREKLDGWRNWTIENNNIAYTKVDYRTIEFKFVLKANSEQKIMYRVHYKRYNW